MATLTKPPQFNKNDFIIDLISSFTLLRMALTKACCTLPPVTSDYTPPGTTIDIGDLPVYETIPNNSKKLLICVYDIFGVHENIRQVSETLALAGFRVVIPDFFRGKPITKEIMAQG